MTSLAFMMVILVITSTTQAEPSKDGGCPRAGDCSRDDDLDSVVMLQARDQLIEKERANRHAKGNNDCEACSEEGLLNYTCLAAWVDNGCTSHYHDGSGWNYLSDEEYDEMVMDAARHVKPPIQDHDSVFELGMGVGAALKALSSHVVGLRTGGSDLSTEAVELARKVLKGHRGALPMLVQDMRSKHDSIPDGSFDHVVSFGALAMYLTREEMLTAIGEAARMTKPGGSLLFAHFVEPDGYRMGQITGPVEKSFWAASLPKLGLEDVEVHGMKHQGDRYMVTCRKHT